MGGGGLTEPLAGTRLGLLERGHISALPVPRTAVAGTDCIGKEGSFERGAHQRPRGVWEVRSVGRGVGQHIALVVSFATDLFLEFRLDRVQGEVFPAVFRLELRQRKAVL